MTTVLLAWIDAKYESYDPEWLWVFTVLFDVMLLNVIGELI